ncbi:hypothetical protein F441_18482 [Phytophthora nicotianae CJ01A1]|uniref:Peptidase M43 pregnancy-associated plasma-A domain-containing protein n=2 Tax=Phytophthora nicotianae TaxID=4792 RepID=W2PK87_PHYN3|nr:hypothetical protein PPTG_17207 [Phytophthora nicotianae INRA-310]ETN01418.1 hypothetical protein PPTG_17207 [Phytophthora nicotianae INRA-310]ETP04824.1 hypothetical protein F441_18482 [Phytophthora nicotianae CJ01A1]
MMNRQFNSLERMARRIRLLAAEVTRSEDWWDADGVPQCPEACYKHKDFATNAETSACKGVPFDMSLWPTLCQGGGAGGDWGQRIDEDAMISSINEEQVVMVAHEIGHVFGLADFYETIDQPNEDFPVCIMKAGSSRTVTPVTVGCCVAFSNASSLG